MVSKPKSKDYMIARINVLESENERLKEQIIKLTAYVYAIDRSKENAYAKRNKA